MARQAKVKRALVMSDRPYTRADHERSKPMDSEGNPISFEAMTAHFADLNATHRETASRESQPKHVPFGMRPPLATFGGRGVYRDTSAWKLMTDDLDLKALGIRQGTLDAAMSGDRPSLNKICKRVCLLIQNREKALKANSQAVSCGEAVPESVTDFLIAAITEWMECAGAPMSRAYVNMMNTKLRTANLESVARVESGRKSAAILAELIIDPDLTIKELADRRSEAGASITRSTLSRQIKVAREYLASLEALAAGKPE